MHSQDNHQTFRERASLAASSSHLRQASHNCSGIDYVLAMGVAAARGNAQALPILRLNAMATGPDFEAAYLYTLGVARKLQARRHWHVTYAAVCQVARTALAMHVNPVCPHCNGLKFKVAAGAPGLCAVLCPHCRGDGRRQIPHKHHEEVGQVLVELEMLDDKTEAVVRGLLQ